MIATAVLLLAQLTCEPASVTLSHCWSDHGYLSTEERSGEYIHGHDNAGRSWTIWQHDGRSYLIERK
jgi:hypothetical protein